MLVVSGPPTVKVFLFRGNGKSRLCVKFVPGEKECFAHIFWCAIHRSLHASLGVVCRFLAHTASLEPDY